MANAPRKMQDPTEAALSAIQDALNLREAEQTTPATEMPRVPSVEAAAEGWPRSPRPRGAEQDLFDDPAPAMREPAGRRAANDDRRSVGQILQTLQQGAGGMP